MPGTDSIRRNKPLAFAAIAEMVTGLALIVAPALVARFLLGADLTGVGLPVGRVAGIGLLSLGLACWPRNEPLIAARCGMMTYNVLITLFFLFLGIQGERSGSLLWPGVALHATLSWLLLRGWFAAKRAGDDGSDGR